VLSAYGSSHVDVNFSTFERNTAKVNGAVMIVGDTAQVIKYDYNVIYIV
jgi:hypothetical protein